MTYKYVVDSKLLAYYLIQRGRPLSDIFNKMAELIYHLQRRGDIYVCFDIGHSDFRETEQSYYKGHRRAAMAKKSEAEKIKHELFNEMYAKLPYVFRGMGVHVVAVPGVEADDLASILCKEFENVPDVKVTMLTADRDWLHMVVEANNIRLYDYVQNVYYTASDVIKQYEASTRREFSIRKSITGDKSDNIKFMLNMAEEKGSKLSNAIHTQYGEPTNDECIESIEEYLKENPNLKVHKFHVEDGRTTVREAFESNMKIADPFTSIDQLTKLQASQLQDVFDTTPITIDTESLDGKFIELFGYPLQLSSVAKKIYNVN